MISKQTECQDGMLWIGKSYTTINQYIKEAEYRGCCRKVRHIPSWLVPGKSKIFLAHNGGCDRDQGKIFGYFELAGIETSGPLGKISNRMVPGATRGLTGGVFRADNGVPIQTAVVIARNDAGEEVWDSSDKEGRYKLLLEDRAYSVSTFVQGFCPEECRIGPETECKDFYLYALPKKVPDSSPEGGTGAGEGFKQKPGKTVGPAAGIWDNGGSACGPLFEPDRKCGDRSKPGSYILDNRSAGVSVSLGTRYCRAQTYREPVQNGWNGKTEEPTAILGPFTESLEHLNAEHPIPSTRLPPCLEGKASLKGELVVFNKPLQYESIPHACFQGFRRVDGDFLIDQVVAGKNHLKIPYCVADISQNKRLVAEIALKFGLNRATSTHIVESLIELFKEEIKQQGKLKLNGFGTFWVNWSEARIGRIPNSKVPISIPAMNRLSFKPGKKLRAQLEDSRVPARNKPVSMLETPQETPDEFVPGASEEEEVYCWSC